MHSGQSASIGFLYYFLADQCARELLGNGIHSHVHAAHYGHSLHYRKYASMFRIRW